MRVLVVGGGGREHALCWKIAQSPKVSELYCAPGNGGIAKVAKVVDIGAEDLERLLRFAKDKRIDITVVGPEAPLVSGIVDLFEGEGLKVFGPSRKAAEIEGSKAFAKEFMKRHGVPTASFKIFKEPEEAKSWIKTQKKPLVVKASGLAAGKGSIVCEGEEEALNAIDLMMVKKAFGQAGEEVVVEERLYGQEVSFLCFCDGENLLPLSASQDHKPLFDGDKGPNTGGMGAYSPVPFFDHNLEKKVLEWILWPTVRGLKEEGRPYKGVLYAGLMVDEKGEPWVLEFNCRFGDPETQPLMVRMKGDLVEIILACVEGRLKEVSIDWDPRPSVCVVMAQQGYPGPYEKGKEIKGLQEAETMEDVWVFHAGTVLKEGKFYNSGGRVLGVTALGRTYAEAIERAYIACSRIQWEGVYYRKDIGFKALRYLGQSL